MKLKVFTIVTAILAVPGFSSLRCVAQSVPNLINYQGRLTDQTGTALPQAVYQIQFRIWDSPTATNTGDLIWGQQQTLALQSNGAFATILGSGGTAIPGAATNDLSFAFSQTNRFIGVTVVSSNGITISGASEILPRQQVLSSPYAMVAASVSDGSITTSKIVAGAISTAQLADGTVTLPKLAPRLIGASVGIGGLAITPSSGSTGNTAQLSATITTTGRPVFITLIPDGVGNANISSYINDGGVVTSASVYILRDGTTISQSALVNIGNTQLGGEVNITVPPGCVSTIDASPPSGSHVYTVTIVPVQAGSTAFISSCKLVAFEL